MVMELTRWLVVVVDDDGGTGNYSWSKSGSRPQGGDETSTSNSYCATLGGLLIQTVKRNPILMSRYLIIVIL